MTSFPISFSKKRLSHSPIIPSYSIVHNSVCPSPSHCSWSSWSSQFTFTRLPHIISSTSIINTHSRASNGSRHAPSCSIPISRFTHNISRWKFNWIPWLSNWSWSTTISRSSSEGVNCRGDSSMSKSSFDFFFHYYRKIFGNWVLSTQSTLLVYAPILLLSLH